MKRLKYPLGLLACLLVSAAVPLAYGSEAAKDPRVPALIAKVNSLQKQVNALTVKSNCLGIQGLQQFGQAQGEGYLYHNAADPPNVLVLTSALDFPEQGQTPQMLMAIVDPKCVSTSRALYKNRTLFRSADHVRVKLSP
jgi:hypothetical protein